MGRPDVFSELEEIYADLERELATLRVVGFTPGETWRVVAGSVAAQVAAAIPLGWAVGAACTWLTTRATASELMRLPFLVTRSTCALAALVVVIASAAVALYARRWVGHLDLVAVLKSKE